MHEEDYADYWEDPTPDYDLWETEQVFRDGVAEREAEECTCRTYAVSSPGGDGYGSNYTDSTGCPVHDDYEDGPEDSYLDSYWEDQYETPWGE